MTSRLLLERVGDPVYGEVLLKNPVLRWADNGFVVLKSGAWKSRLETLVAQGLI